MLAPLKGPRLLSPSWDDWDDDDDDAPRRHRPVLHEILIGVSIAAIPLLVSEALQHWRYKRRMKDALEHPEIFEGGDGDDDDDS